DHSIDDRPESRPLPVSEPRDPGGESLPRNELFREFDPSDERRIILELPGHDLVRLQDVVRVPRDRDPAERSPTLAEHRADEERDEALEIERVRHACL